MYPACVVFIALENTAEIAYKKEFQVFETTFECINILSLCIKKFWNFRDKRNGVITSTFTREINRLSYNNIRIIGASKWTTEF